MKHARPDYQDRIVDLMEPRIYIAVIDAELAALSSASVIQAFVRQTKDNGYILKSPAELEGLLVEMTKLDNAARLLRSLYGFLERPYGRKPIPDDEPVFLLRGQDKYAALAVQGWIGDQRESGLGDEELLAGAKEQLRAMREWSVQKNPDAAPKDEPDQLFDLNGGEVLAHGTGTVHHGDGEAAAEAGDASAGDASASPEDHRGATDEDAGRGGASPDQLSGPAGSEVPGPARSDGVHGSDVAETETA